jgi:hypothetical protein
MDSKLLNFVSLCVCVLVPSVGLAAPVSHVTLCSTDTQVGPGTNLSQALTNGGDIFLQCPPRSVIRITQKYVLNVQTQIIGVGVSALSDNIVLDGAGMRGPFISVANGKLTVQSVSFRNFAAGTLPSRVPSIVVAEGFPILGVMVPFFDSVIDATSDVELDQVQVTGSDSPVRTSGALTVNNSWFGQNTGVVLMSLGVVSMSSSVFEKNTEALGFHKGSVLNSTFDGSTLGAVNIFLPAGTVEIRHCNFVNTTGTSALVVTAQSSKSGSATVNIRGNSFTSNNGGSESGAIQLYIASGSPAAASTIANLPSTHFNLFYDDFSKNAGGSGGAVSIASRNTDDLTILGATFMENTATVKGGGVVLFGGEAAIVHSLFKNNSAPVGAAVASQSTGKLIIANSLVVENVATAAMPSQPDETAAIYAANLSMTNVTIANNRAIGLSSAGSGLAVFSNLIISQNEPQNCLDVARASFKGPNLQFGPATCDGASLSGDPLLDSFYVPSPGSPALHLGDLAICQTSPVDSSDFVFQPRTNRNFCALGAYERPPNQFKPTFPTQGPYAPEKVLSR